MPPELIAGADGKRRGSVSYGSPDALALDLQQVLVDEPLVAVGAAADQEHVDAVGVDGAAELQVLHLHVDAAPAAAHDHGPDVADVAVLAHHARVQVAEDELHLDPALPASGPASARAGCPVRAGCPARAWRQNGATVPRRTSSRRSAHIEV